MGDQTAVAGLDVVTIAGQALPDPYRSLEHDSEATLAWQAAQDERAEKALHGWAHYGELSRLLASMSPGRFDTAPKHRTDRWFFTAVPPGSDRRVVLSGATANAVDAKIVIDPRTRTAETLWDYWPSPDGRIVAYASIAGAAEGGELRVMDVASGEEVCAPLLFSTWTRLAWAPDSSGFYFNGITIDGGEVDGLLWYQPARGTAPIAQPIAFPGLACYADVSPDGRHVVASIGLNELRPAYRLDTSEGGWRPFLPDVDFHLHGTVVGDEYVAVTTLGADRGRVVAVPLDSPDALDEWREVVPHSAVSIRAVTVVGAHLVLSELVDGCSRLRIVRRDTGTERVVPLRHLGVITTAGQAAPSLGVPTVDVSSGHNELTFLTSAAAAPHSAFRYDLDADRLECLASADDLPATTTTRVHATSRDGTPVPCYLTHLSTLDRDRPQPTLLLAYGGWNLPNTPRYTRQSAAFVMSGGIVAHAILRGGGEYGREWWQAGRRASKQNTFDDLVAVADRLITERITEARLLGLQGGSAGGLTAGAAVTQRPDLFAAVAATAPVLDLLRSVPGGATTSAKDELGDPDDPDDAQVLATYSPYHHLERRDYPPVLVVAAEHDVRTPAWHSRKFVARLQAVTSSSSPAYLRIWKAMGHGTGATVTTERTAEWLGFIMKHLGVRPARAGELRAGTEGDTRP